jgi:V/A-type H+-transporting ATPase subunit F
MARGIPEHEGRIAFIGDIDTVLGFRALGVDTVVPDSDEQAAEEFGRLVSGGYSVIMVTEDLVDALAEQIEETAHRALPAVVVLPGIAGRQRRGEETIRRLITRAVGVDLMAEDGGGPGPSTNLRRT